jgi:hypothetical protein
MMWIVGGASVGLLLLALLGGGAYMLLSDDDTTAGTPPGGPVGAPPPGLPGTGTTPGTGGTVPIHGAVGSIILITNVTGGQLMVDGAPLGDAQHGREVSVTAGPHQIAIAQAGTVVAQQNVNVLPNVPTQVQLVTTNPIAPPTQGVPGVAPDVRSGTLAAGDSTLNSGEFSDRHDFHWTAGERYSVDARSSTFDTYLIIKPPSGNQIDNDDRSQGAGTDAGYDVDVTQTGTWQVLVTSFRPGEVGAYTLHVQRVR